MIQCTAKQLGEKLGVDYAVAANLAKVIVSSGQGREAGKTPFVKGGGKPSTIYELPDVFTLSLVGGAASSIKDASNPLAAAAQYTDATPVSGEKVA